MNKNKLNNLLNLCFMALLIMATGNYTYHSYETGRIKNYWADYKSQELDPSKKKGRFPSSNLLIEGSPDIVNILKTYFQFETYNKYLNYDLDVQFKTDLEDQVQTKQAETLLKQTFASLLSTPGSKVDIASQLFEDKLFEKLMHDCVEQFKTKNITSGTFEINLNFSPIISSYFNYHEELSSNQLLQWDKTDDHELELTTLDHSISQKAIQTKIPLNDEPYQYKGGQISLHFKLVSLKSDIQINLPEDFVASGHIRFRKFFRAPHIAQGIKLRENANISFDQSTFLSHQERDPYVTVDLIQEFNHSHPTPKLSRVEFTFGKLLENRFASKKEDIFTGDLILKGSYLKQAHSYEFESVLQTLVFDFNKGNFIRDSKIKTMIKTPTGTPQQRGRLQNQIFEELIDDLGIELIQKLKLGSVQYFKGAQ